MGKSIKGTRTEKNLMVSFCRRVSGQNEIHLLCQCGKERGL